MTPLASLVLRHVRRHPSTLVDLCARTGAERSDVRRALLEVARAREPLLNLGDDVSAVWFSPDAEEAEILEPVLARHQ